MTDRLEDIDIQFQKRNVRKRGQTSSDQQNDATNEIAHDFAALSDQWNNRLVPLQATIPNGTEGILASAVDAYKNGLDGRTLLVDSRATSTVRPTYFNTAALRANTVWEQIDAVYTLIAQNKTDLENQINTNILTASQISIVDTASLYTANNVEAALAEVMVKANAALIVNTSISTFASVNEHILPALDNTYDLGNSTTPLRFRDIHLGPASVNIVALVTDVGQSANKDYHIGINGTSGKLEILDTTTAALTIDSLTAQFPGKLILPLTNDATSPTLQFGDGDTGLYESADDTLAIATAGTQRVTVSDSALTLVPTTYQLILPLSNDAVTPTLAFGDGDTGFYESADDTLKIAFAGSDQYTINTSSLSATFTGAFLLRNTVASSTIPTLCPSNDDPDTGLGVNSTDELSLIAGGAEIARIESTGLTLIPTTAQLDLPISNDAVTPTLAFGGNSGFYESATDFISLSLAGTARYRWSGAQFQGLESNSGMLMNETGSSTNPVHTGSGDPDTGFSMLGDIIHGIRGGAETIRVDSVGLTLVPTTAQLVLPLSNDATTPTLAFGNGNSGIYESTDDTLKFATSGVDVFTLDGGQNVEILNNLAVDGQYWQTAVTTSTPSGTTQTIDWNNGTYQVLDLESATGDVTVTLTNGLQGASYILEIIQDSAVARDIVWPGSVTWQGGTTPVISTTLNGIDVVSLIFTGTAYRANIGQDYS